MLGNEKDGHGNDGAAMRTTLGRYLPVILAMVLLIPFQSVNAAVQMTSGSTEQLGNTLQYGSTAYVVTYSYPSTAQVGTNLTITLSLHINSLNGVVDYILNYNLEAQIFIGTHELHEIFNSGNGAPFLYAGSTWGPNNFTFPLTAENTGLAKGASANASVNIILKDYVHYGVPYLTYAPEPQMEAQGGSLLIQNAVASTSTSITGQVSGGGQTYLPYVLLASGAVLMIFAVMLPRGPRSPKGNQK